MEKTKQEHKRLTERVTPVKDFKKEKKREEACLVGPEEL